MKTYTYTNTMLYTYDSTRKGSKYLIGDAFKNHGEFLESVAKYHRGLDYLANPNTRWDEGSDIEELQASVKSAGASLGSIYGNSYESIKKYYFENVASTLWIFMIDSGDEITEYRMNRTEFEAFLDEFHTLTKDSGSHLQKVRISNCPGTMKIWFL